ncbi:MAG: 7-carboxy-7-deazaguanine synthase QueE [Planctomycetota bacterium]
MHISEVFESIQGEGPWAGTRSLFIRTSGCNLRCSFCDTPYTSWKPEGTARSIEELVREVGLSPAPDVVITGGEPLLVPTLPTLIDYCRRLGKRVTVETAGTVDLEFTCDLVAISPKLANSTPTGSTWESRHEAARFRPPVIRSLLQRSPGILKFVIDQPRDLDEVLETLRAVSEINRSLVWLMPQARTREQLREKSHWLRELARSHGFNFSSRLHVEMFGDQRGT